MNATEGLPTRAQFDAASPFEKGFMAYTFSAWPGSTIPDESVCPYPIGSSEAEDFHRGVQHGVIAAQDSEE